MGASKFEKDTQEAKNAAMKNALKRANNALSAAEKGLKVSVAQAAQEKQSKQRVAELKANLQKTEVNRKKAESEVEFEKKQSELAKSTFKAVEKNVDERSKKTEVKTKQLKETQKQLEKAEATEWGAYKSKEAAKVKKMQTSEMDALDQVIENTKGDIRTYTADYERDKERLKKTKKDMSRTSTMKQKMKDLFKAAKKRAKDPYFIDGSKFSFKQGSGGCKFLKDSPDDELELGESDEMGASKFEKDTQEAKNAAMEIRTKKCIRCNPRYPKSEFTVSNQDKKGTARRRRKRFRMAFKAPGAQWCSDAGGVLQCDKKKVGKDETFTMISVRRGSGQWYMQASSGKYCVASKSSGSHLIKCDETNKRKAKKASFSAKCTSGCDKYAKARSKALLAEKMVSRKYRKLSLKAKMIEGRLKQVETRELQTLKEGLKKLRSRKTFLEETHAAKLLSFREVKQKYKKQREQRIQAKRKQVDARKGRSEADNKVDASKQALNNREVAARKSAAAEAEKTPCYYEGIDRGCAGSPKEGRGHQIRVPKDAQASIKAGCSRIYQDPTCTQRNS